MSVDNHRSFQAKLKFLETIRGQPDEAEQASAFVHGLDKARYLFFIDNIDRGVMSTPKTLAKAYLAASKQVVRVNDVKQAVHQALIGHMDKQKKPPSGEEGPTKDDGRGSEGKEERKDNRICYACGRQGHIRRGCKALKEQKDAYKLKWDAEMAHVAEEEESDVDEGYADETSYVCLDYGCQNEFAAASLKARRAKSIKFDSMCSELRSFIRICESVQP